MTAFIAKVKTVYASLAAPWAYYISLVSAHPHTAGVAIIALAIFAVR